jgi:hypothetical protein
MSSSDNVSAVRPDGMMFPGRGRPDHIEETSPALLPLLRGEGPEHKSVWEARDDLDSARGLIAGAAIGLALWPCGALLCYLTCVLILR